MPRSIQEILDHADELAQRFEDYEPSADDERPIEEYLLQRAVLTRARSERQILDAVIAARSAGISWAKIGERHAGRYEFPQGQPKDGWYGLPDEALALASRAYDWTR